MVAIVNSMSNKPNLAKLLHRKPKRLNRITICTNLKTQHLRMTDSPIAAKNYAEVNI